MMYLIAFAIVALLGIVLLQIGKISELAASVRGEEEVEEQSNNRTGVWLVIFMILFLVGCVYSAWYYRNDMLGYGPWESSSEHGKSLDSLFNVTLFFTGIVFVITQVLTFWYAYKYRKQEGRKAVFYAHDNKLELIWTAIPAVVMAYLVANGLVAWNKVMPDLDPNEPHIAIEATGYQFAWDIRLAGNDGKIGQKNFTLIEPATNALGVDYNDPASLDDIILSGADKIVLPVDTTVRVQITSKDVLHNFYLPHFRVKMDAVPGLPTYFIFKPTKTTAQMREELRAYPEWNVPSDPADPASPKRWETFEYELACAELCGKGHYSMRRIVEIVEKDDYELWVAGQKSTYKTSIRGTAADPFKDKLLLDFEIADRKRELDIYSSNTWSKIAADGAADSTITAEDLTLRLKNVFYETGSAALNQASYNELDYIATLLNKYPSVRLEVGGHTDNVGDAGANLELSRARAQAVYNRLVEKGVSAGRLVSRGYGPNTPLESNDTDEGKAKNRRTELKILSKTLN